MKGTELHSFASGFKDVFKRERERAGFTQKSFAKYFDVSLDTVRNWEQGRKVPEIRTIERLCGEFDCEPDYLLGRMENSTHDIQFICDQTALSEDAVLALGRLKEDRAATKVLDFLLTNKIVLDKIVLYFASAFWDIDRRSEFSALPFDRQKIDPRLFSADAHDGIVAGKEFFHDLYEEDDDISRQMVFKLLRTCMRNDSIKGLEEFIDKLSPKEEF